ncbi:MAG: enoyl-CoA hydratase-related protein, partial [Bacteroidota bacterium]
GADIKVFEANTIEENKEMVKHAQQAANLLSFSKKITIAAIKGHALGGGLELAMACDIRLGAKENYFLGLPEIKLGLIPGNGGTQRLIRLIGKSAAFELLLTGDSIGPEKAFQLGLFNHLYDKETFEEAVSVFAENLAKGPAQAMTAIKQCIKGLEMPLEEGLTLETQWANTLYDTEDAKEGYAAFLEKREPRFK